MSSHLTNLQTSRHSKSKTSDLPQGPCTHSQLHCSIWVSLPQRLRKRHTSTPVQRWVNYDELPHPHPEVTQQSLQLGVHITKRVEATVMAQWASAWSEINTEQYGEKALPLGSSITLCLLPFSISPSPVIYHVALKPIHTIIVPAPII